MSQYLSSTTTCGQNTIWLNFTGKQGFLVSTDFELQYTIFNLLKIYVLTVKSSYMGSGEEVLLHTLFLAKFVLFPKQFQLVVIFHCFFACNHLRNYFEIDT